MSTMRISGDIRNTIAKKYGLYYAPLSKLPPEKIVDDVLSISKINEQISLIERLSGEKISGKKVLDLGSGYGIFVLVATKEHGADVFGVEPGSEGFGDSFELSQKILKDNGMDPARITKGIGESLPYPDGSFDIVYSSNVLEHVMSPTQVFAEAIRVTKPGGFIQIIFPSYGSFFDGHYACFYMPYQPKWLWKLWIKYVLGRDPSYVDTLRTELNYWSTKRILRQFASKVEVLGTGEDVFRERMQTINITPYAGLGRVKAVVDFLRLAGLARFVASWLLLFKAHSPLIVSLRKRSSA